MMGKSPWERKKSTGAIRWLELALSINADVIDEHGLRKSGGGVGRAGPVAAYRHIQNNEERMVEYPFPAGGPVGGMEGGVEVRVDVKTDNVRLPFDRVKMKSPAKFWPAGSWKVEVRSLVGPLVPGPCSEPWIARGSLPTFSMMSISPHFGQPAGEMSSPSIQNAGHIPCPSGILMRDSNRP